VTTKSTRWLPHREFSASPLTSIADAPDLVACPWHHTPGTKIRPRLSARRHPAIWHTSCPFRYLAANNRGGGSCQGNAGCGAGLVLVFDDEFTGNQLEHVSSQTPTSMTWSAVGGNGHAALVFLQVTPINSIEMTVSVSGATSTGGTVRLQSSTGVSPSIRSPTRDISQSGCRSQAARSEPYQGQRSALARG
jgi:hypothetical protein